MVNSNRNRKNQPPTGEGKEQSKHRGEPRKLGKRSDVVQAQRGHPELNLGDADERVADHYGLGRLFIRAGCRRDKPDRVTPQLIPRRQFTGLRIFVRRVAPGMIYPLAKSRRAVCLGHAWQAVALLLRDRCRA